MKKTTIYLSDEQMAELDAVSRRKHMPKAHLIREAVAEYIAAEPTPMPAWIGIYDGEPEPQNGVVLTSETVDEWLEANWHPE
jgi:predicted transcriptional regulator